MGTGVVDADDEVLLAALLERELANGHPDALLWDDRFLFLWPDPLQPGVGHRSTVSLVTTTLGGALSRRGQPERLR